MKAKKALKKLNKVEALLSHIIQAFPASKQGVGSLLGSAKETIGKAIQSVNSANGTSKAKAPTRSANAATRSAKAPTRVAKASNNGNGRLSEEGRRRISLAAK